MNKAIQIVCMATVAVGVGFCLPVDNSAYGDVPSFQWLGVLNEDEPNSRPSGISADGLVVVGRSENASSPREAFRWTSDDGMVGLGDLDEGAFDSWAHGVSADGSVVAGWGHSASGREAFRWTESDGMVPLGDLPGGAFDSGANDVSADGSVLVGNGRKETPVGVVGFVREAIRWTQATGMVGLGDLPGGMIYSNAFGVSADGSVVVGYSGSTFGGEGFRWTQATGIVGLGDLDGGDFYSIANAVSADSSVVVGFSKSGSGEEAFRWTEADDMVGLGSIPGRSESKAYATSGDGSVVVGIAQDTAFIWDATNGMRSLQDVLEDDCGLDLTGWVLIGATGVSLDGRTIIGWGRNSGYGKPHEEAFIATIPEPATLSLLALGGLAMLRRRRK